MIVDIVSKFCEFELFKFGGYDLNGFERFDSFYIGTLQDGDPAKPIEWKLVPQYTLKDPMADFGYIQYGPFIVTFGGRTVGPRASSRAPKVFGYERLDEIYILDLRDNKGWIESAIKCPMKAVYHAVLDYVQRVHLFPLDEHQQFCIDLKDLIPYSECL